MFTKLILKFTREFIDKSGISNVKIFNPQGKDMTTGLKDSYLTQDVLKESRMTESTIYIPLYSVGDLEAILVVPLRENPFLNLEKAEQLRDTLEHTLFHVKRNRSFSNPDLENEFLLDLILRDKLQDQEQIMERARMVNFNVEIERQLIFIDIRNFKKRTRKHPNQDSIQEVLKDVYHLLQEGIETYNEYVIHLYDDKFVLLKEKKINVRNFLEDLREKSLRELKLDLLFVISEPCLTTEDYYISFKKIHAFHQSYIRKETTQYLFEINNYEVELLLLGVSKEAQDLFLYSKKAMLLAVKEKYIEFIETFNVFFKCNLNTKETAQLLYLHSNTIYYRIKRLSELLDMDLFKPNDALSLYIALQFLNPTFE